MATELINNAQASAINNSQLHGPAKKVPKRVSKIEALGTLAL